MQIETENKCKEVVPFVEKGREVVPAMEKGKEMVPPLEEVSPTAEDVVLEEPLEASTRTTGTTMRRQGQLTSARRSLPRSWSVCLSL